MVPGWIDVHGTPLSVVNKFPHPETVPVPPPKKKKRQRRPTWRSQRKAAYQAYLASAHWANLKASKATEDQKCGGCYRRTSLQLHHMVYRKQWTDAQPEDLMWLCAGCHEEVHRLQEIGQLKFKAEVHSPAVMAVMTKAALRRAYKASLAAFRQCVGAKG